MRIENTFEVPVRLEQAWQVLTDIERIAPCMPGATLTEVVDDKTYKGSVAIKLGPVALSFGGTATFEEIDHEQHRAMVRTEGRDSKGRGNVAADVQFELKEAGAVTQVLLTTDLKLSGMVAQYGRGAGMITDVATHWVKSFSDCLSEQLSEQTLGEPADDVSESPSAVAKPVPVLGLGLQVVLSAVIRRIKNLFVGKA